MKREKKMIPAYLPAASRPETVQELIDLLSIFDPNHAISFGELNLFRLKDVGDCVNFEFNEGHIVHDAIMRHREENS